MSGWDAQLLSLMNHARAQHGLAPLHLTTGLDSEALTWSRHMAATGTLAHDPNVRAHASAVCPAWTVAGENVGYSPDVTTLFNAYMNSPEHRANILNPRYTAVGLATVSSAGTLWNTQKFANNC